MTANGINKIDLVIAPINPKVDLNKIEAFPVDATVAFYIPEQKYFDNGKPDPKCSRDNPTNADTYFERVVFKGQFTDMNTFVSDNTARVERCGGTQWTEYRANYELKLTMNKMTQ